MLDLFTARRRHLRRHSDSTGLERKICWSDSSTNTLTMKTNSGTRTILLKRLRFVGIGNSESFGGNKHHNSNANAQHFVSPRQAPSREHEPSFPHRDLDYDVNLRRNLFVQSDGANLSRDHQQHPVRIVISDAALWSTVTSDQFSD